MASSAMIHPKHEYKAHGVIGLKAAHPLISTLKRTAHEPEIHGTKVWRSSWVMMDYIHKQIKPTLKKPSAALDIGCGWGLMAIYLQKKLKAKVTAIDADAHVFAFLQAQAQRNHIQLDTKVQRYQHITGQQLTSIDIIAGCDICFWDELVKPLYNLINRAIKAQVHYILISDPGRSTFHQLCQLCQDKLGKKVKEVTVIEHSINKPFNSQGSILVIRV